MLSVCRTASDSFSSSLVLHKSLGPVMFFRRKVNESSLSLHNHVAAFQLCAVLFWSVSLFPMTHPSNQLGPISDFPSSLLKSSWLCGPKGKP